MPGSANAAASVTWAITLTKWTSTSLASLASVPLENISTQLQIDATGNARHLTTTLYQRHGVRGFFHGGLSAMLGRSVFYTTSLPLYYHLKERMPSHIPAVVPAYLSACVGGFWANPFFVAKVRYQSDILRTTTTTTPSPSLGRRLMHMFHREGVKSWLKGYNVSLVKNIEVALYYPLSDLLREKCEWQPAPAMMTAKLIVACALYPLEPIRTLQRFHNNNTHRHPLSPLHIANTLYQEQGLRRFYRGFILTQLRSVPTSVLAYMTYWRLLASKK